MSILLLSFHGRLLSKGCTAGVGSGYTWLRHQTADLAWKSAANLVKKNINICIVWSW